MNMLTQHLSHRYLQPGELILGKEPMIVSTVLGSCVAVTMFSGRLKEAAICHAILPSFQACDAHAAELAPYRYVSHVVQLMCTHFQDAGANPAEIEVKLFGGSNVLHVEQKCLSECWIGSANIREARTVLHRNGFRIKASNVAGNRGRKLVFNTQTGEVLHKHLPRF